MPRRCPSEVITHRIELGTAERVQLKKIIKVRERDVWLENIPNVMMGVGAVAGGAIGWLLNDEVRIAPCDLVAIPS